MSSIFIHTNYRIQGESDAEGCGIARAVRSARGAVWRGAQCETLVWGRGRAGGCRSAGGITSVRWLPAPKNPSLHPARAPQTRIEYNSFEWL